MDRVGMRGYKGGSGRGPGIKSHYKDLEVYGMRGTWRKWRTLE